MTNIARKPVVTVQGRLCIPIFRMLAVTMFGLLFAILGGPMAIAQESLPGSMDHVRLVTTEWPPYSGEDLPGKGLVSIIVKGAFARNGTEVQLSVIPWRRALRSMSPSENTADAIFPLYGSAPRRSTFYLSEAISFSPVGFVFIRGSTFDWQTLDDLDGLTIGTVGGYVNTPTFDARVASGKIKTIEANDDLSLLRLLQAGRVDAVVMDQLVARQLLDTLSEFQTTRRLFVFHNQPLAFESLHVGFKRTPDGRLLRNIFNRGLRALRCTDNDCRNSWPRTPYFSYDNRH